MKHKGKPKKGTKTSSSGPLTFRSMETGPQPPQPIYGPGGMS